METSWPKWDDSIAVLLCSFKIVICLLVIEPSVLLFKDLKLQLDTFYVQGNMGALKGSFIFKSKKFYSRIERIIFNGF